MNIHLIVWIDIILMFSQSIAEKKDLVELVLLHSGVPSPVEDTTWEEEGIR